MGIRRMRRLATLLIVGLFFVGLVASCGRGGGGGGRSPSARATATAEAAAATATASAPTPTPTPTISATPTPTLTSSPPPTPTPTSSPPPTPTPTPGPVPVPGGASNFEVYFIDVGQGDATLIVSSGGNAMLIDGGRSKARIRDRLTSLGITDLDAILATHADADHIAGLIEAFAMFEVERFYWNGTTSDTQTFQDLMTAAGAEGIPIVTPTRGDTIPLGHLSFQVLHPASLTGNGNADSLVTQLSCGTVDIVFTGDAEVSSEQVMLDAGVLSDIELLKVGHHGSRSSTSQAFLDAITPEFGLISAGLNNQYGHPHQEVVDRLTAAGVQLLFTDTTDGADTVLLSSDCQSMTFSQATGAPQPTPTPTALATPTPMPTATATSPPTVISTVTPTLTATAVTTATNVVIDCIFFDGLVPRTEADEYVQITNRGAAAQDMAGWVLVDVDEGYPRFVFPGFVLMAGQTIRVYTNQVHPGWGSFSFASGRAVWNNSSPDLAVLRDASSEEVSRKSYPPGC